MHLWRAPFVQTNPTVCQDRLRTNKHRRRKHDESLSLLVLFFVRSHQVDNGRHLLQHQTQLYMVDTTAVWCENHQDDFQPVATAVGWLYNTANCIIIDHFSHVNLNWSPFFSRCRLNTAGNGSNGPKFEHRRVSKPSFDFLADPDSRSFSRFGGDYNTSRSNVRLR